MTSSSPPPRRTLLWPLITALSFYAVFIARTGFLVNGDLYFSLFDDAMISMRYASNLADGFGLVWNPGLPPVEGFTNPLWTAWMAVLHLLPVPEGLVPLAVAISGALCVLGAAWFAYRIALTIAPGATSAATAAFALTAFYFPLVYWSVRGMEVGLLALLVAATTLIAVRLAGQYRARPAQALAALLAVMQWVRPDAIVPTFVIIAYLAVILHGRDRRHLLVVTILAVGVTIAVQTALRAWYYGDVLPNTYYLKVAGASLADRLGRGLPIFVKTLVVHYWMLIPMLALLALAEFRGAVRHAARLPILVFLGQCAYSISVGGDIEEQLEMANRYFSIGVPGIMAFVCVRVFETDFSRLKVAAALVTLGGVSVAAVAMMRYGALHLERTWMLDWSEYRALAEVCVLATGVLALVAVMNRFGRVPRRWLPVAALAALFISVDGYALLNWVKHGAPVANTDETMTRLGLELRRRAPHDTVIAVVFAGSTPYWSGLPSVDLLGKSDREIAHGPHVRRFQPGHSKWNYRYSVTTYHPDVILQTYHLSGADRAFLEEAGYLLTENGMYVNQNSGRIRGAGLDQIYPRMFHISESG